MNSKNKERRVINIAKEDFDIIKSFCDKNAINMPKWLIKIALEKIKNGKLIKNEPQS